jgi:hypothetical protein
LLIGAKTVRAFGVESLRDDPKRKLQVSTLPLDRMNGLEVPGISKKGAVPVKIQSGVGNHRGRRAVRLVNDDSPVGTVSDGQFSRSSRGLTSKTAPLKLKLRVSHAWTHHSPP